MVQGFGEMELALPLWIFDILLLAETITALTEGACDGFFPQFEGPQVLRDRVMKRCAC